MRRLFKLWYAQTKGATAIEYALIAAGVALAVSLFIFTFGEELYAFFDFLTETIANA